MKKEKETWTSADEKDGFYHNPLIFADVPDPDIIRTRDKNGREAYYMVSTTMHMAPGVPVMKSYDLVNWKTVNYVYYVLEKEDAFELKNGKNDYACGSWASSIRQDGEGWFYVAFTCESTDKTYILRHRIWKRDGGIGMSLRASAMTTDCCLKRIPGSSIYFIPAL